MGNAERDQNFTPAAQGVSVLDNNVLLPVLIDPTTGGVIVSSGSGTSGGFGAFGQYLTSDPNDTTNAATWQLRVDAAHRLMTNSAPLTSANDSVSAAQSGTWTVLATPNGTYTTQLTAAASATGLTIFSNTAVTNTSVQVLGVSGRLYDVHMANTNAAVIYLQCFDVASATSVTVGTTSPTFVLSVPPTNTEDKSLTIPYTLSLGLKIAATTTPTGSTAPGTALNVTLGTK